MGFIKNIQGIKRGIDTHPVSKMNGKKDIIKRMVAWQSTKAFYNSTGKRVDWVNGRKLVIYPGRTSGVGNYYYGLLEYEPMSFLLHFLNKDDVFFDIGANVGVYSVLGKDAGKVVSFEPAKDTYRILRENVEINGMTNEITVNVGVGEKDGNVTFTTGNDTTNHIVHDGAVSLDTEVIDIRSIDSFFEENDIYPTVMKIDIEGAEFEATRGGYSCLKDDRCNVVVMEIFSDEEKSKWMQELGYGLYAYNPKTRLLTETTSEKAGNNGIYIKDIEKARDRVSKGEKIFYRGMEL